MKLKDFSFRLEKEWSKKNQFTIDNITHGSTKKVWWECIVCGYEWMTQVYNRTILGRNCPFCSNQVVTDKNCLQTTSPKLAEEWNKRNKIKPTEVTNGSSKKVWWKCSKCEYEWEAVINSRKKNGCPACAGQVATEKNCLQNNSPELSKEWHFLKNMNLTPKDVTKNSNKKVWWKCSKCEYEWKARISSRKKRGCPACAGQVATEKNCLQNSFPEISKEWHPFKNTNLTPKDVTRFSSRKVWWKCSKCEYEWEAVIIKRTQRGNKCKNCLNNNISHKEINWIEKNKKIYGDIITQAIIKIKRQKNGVSILIKQNGCEKIIENIIPNKKIYIKKRNFMKLDGLLLSNRIVFEFLGDYWHGNSNNPKYKQKKNNVNKKTFKQLYNKTIEKFNKLLSLGFTIIYRWESENEDKVFNGEDL